MALPYPHPTSPAVTAVMKGNRKTDTRPERAIRFELHRLGLRFRKHVSIAGAGRTVRADICFPRQRLAVFVDGCFWHGCPEHGTRPGKNTAYWAPKLEGNRRRDRAVDAALTAAGWEVIRVWEHEAPAPAAQWIAGLVRSRQSTAARELSLH